MTNEYNPDGKEIRFIDSHYKDLFHIPDGSCVQIHYPDEMVVKPCTFIDEYHTQIGYNVCYITQLFASEHRKYIRAEKIPIFVACRFLHFRTYSLKPFHSNLFKLI